MAAASSQTIRIATRRSALALAQANGVGAAIARLRPDARVELVPLITRGDRARGPLAPAGGKGLFTREIEQALRDGRADLAVHSAKDLPAAMDADLILAAVPVREDARDVLVSAAGGGLEDLRQGAVVGTGSLRRRALLLAARPDVLVKPLRGNVDTRLRKVLESSGALDAVVLAAAGLKRLGLDERERARVHPLAVEAFIPAAGQGALAVQCLAAAAETRELSACLDDPPSRQALEAERAVLLALEAGCHSCVAVHAYRPSEGLWRALGLAARSDGSGLSRFAAEGASAEKAAGLLREQMLSAGAKDLLSR